MPFQVQCGRCKGRLLVEKAGVTVACPHCGAHLTLRAPQSPPAAKPVPAPAPAPPPPAAAAPPAAPAPAPQPVAAPTPVPAPSPVVSTPPAPAPAPAVTPSPAVVAAPVPSPLPPPTVAAVVPESPVPFPPVAASEPTALRPQDAPLPSTMATPASAPPAPVAAAAGPVADLETAAVGTADDPTAADQTFDLGEGSSAEVPTFPELESTLPAGFDDGQELLDPDALLGDVPTVVADQDSVFDDHEELAANTEEEPSPEPVAEIPAAATVPGVPLVEATPALEPPPVVAVAVAAPVAPSAPIPPPDVVPAPAAVEVAPAIAPVVAAVASPVPAAPVIVDPVVATTPPVVPAPPAEPASFPGLPGSDEGGGGFFPDFGYTPAEKGRGAGKGGKTAKPAKTPSREAPRPVAANEVPDFSALGGVASPAPAAPPAAAVVVAPVVPVVDPAPSVAPVAPVVVAPPVLPPPTAPPVPVAAPAQVVAAPVVAAPVIAAAPVIEAPVVPNFAVDVAPVVAPTPATTVDGEAPATESASSTRSRREGRRRKGEGGGVLAVLSGPTVPKMWFVVAASYASALTLILIYLFLTSSRGGYDPYRLESLPDVTPADQRTGAVARQIYQLAERLPPGHVLRVPAKGIPGETRRFGNIEITPLFVRMEPAEFEHYRDKAKARKRSEPVFKLWLRLKNVSTDQNFVPLDAELVAWTGVRDDGSIQANNFVFPNDPRLPDSPRVPMFENPPQSEWKLRGQYLDRALPPGASMETYLASSADGLKELKGELAWRLHLRKGYNADTGRGVTTLVEFVFRSDEIQRPGA